jgi:two-component system osmolarity sensor histidine kinase EnvZ
LRGRYALLLVLLVLLGQLMAAVLLRQLVLRPRLEQAAATTAQTAQAIRAGLLALPAADRAAYVTAFNARELREQADPAAPEPQALQHLRERMLLSPMERDFVRAISQRLDEGGPVLWRRQEDGRLELRLAVEGVDHWLVLPGLRVVREFSGAWLIATAASAALALAMALWLLGRLSRPLARVEQAARQLAAGAAPPPLPEDGPREIATVSRSFNAMVHSLAQADRDRAMMLAGVSHDLRTPLTKLRLGVELGEGRLDEELLASMRRSIEEMDATVGQFLDFARDDALAERVPTQLWSLAQQVCSSQADHGRTIALAGEAPPPVLAHSPALQRALVNLVENAFRHGRPPVAIRAGRDATHAWLDVCDAGDGIPPHRIEELKQPFRRGENARSGVAGAGLGLAIVDQIMRRHGGALILLAGQEGGACARMRLPIAPAQGIRAAAQ